MGSCEKASASSISSVFTPPIKTIDTPMQHGGTPRATTMRPPAAGYKAPTSDYQVEADKQMPRKNESIVSKALEYMFDEQRSLGSPVSPKPDASAEFLPGFLMGDIPAYVTRHTRPLMGVMDMRSPLLAGGSPPKPVVPSYKDKGGAPPVRSIYDDVNSPLLGSTLLRSRKRVSFSVMQNPLSGTMPLTSGTASSEFNPTTMMQSSKATLSPAQLDLFHTQGHALTSDDQLDDSWVTVFGFSQASASYVLLQFAQYGNIIKHVISNTGNWMHIQYQSKLQARKALSKDERIFGECIMIGVKPCIDKSVMGSCEKESTSSSAYVFTPPITTMRPPAAAYKATSDYQVVADKQMPRKEESFVSKVMECLFGW